MAKCKSCQSEFQVSRDDLVFYNKVSPTFGGIRLELSPPQLCPQCRRRRRLAFCNERNLYKRTSSLSGTSLISIYSPDKPLKVFATQEWWGDGWDAEDFAQQISFKESFFEQYKRLRDSVPTKALGVVACENCEYNNDLLYSKNCYLVFGSANCEDCFHVCGAKNLKDCADVWWSNAIELSVGIYCSDNLSACYFCDRCSNSHGLSFCRDCDGCSDCFGCCGLSHKQYCIFNVQYSQADYEKHVNGIDRGSHGDLEDIRKQVNEFYLKAPYRATESIASENCTGDIIYRSRNCQNCFTVVECEDSKYLNQCGRLKDGFDLDDVYDCPGFIYEAIGCTGLFNCAFLQYSHNCSDSYYLTECYNLKNCFGCVGLRDRQYCILNQQYTKEEYKKALMEIYKHLTKLGEWGEFPSMQYSCFGYNESIAGSLFPLSKQNVLKSGGWWSDFQKPPPEAKVIIPAENLPDNIKDVDDDLPNAAIKCEESGRLFRVPRLELEFYRRIGVPLPGKHPDVRHQELLAIRNPQILFKRRCGDCQKEIQTTYSPNRPERVVCEECYIKEAHQ